MEMDVKPRKVKLTKPVLVWLCEKPPGFFKRWFLWRTKRYRVLVPEEWVFNYDELAQAIIDAFLPVWLPLDWRASLSVGIKAKTKAKLTTKGGVWIHDKKE